MKKSGPSTSGTGFKSGLSKQEKFRADQSALPGKPAKDNNGRKPHNDSKC